MSNGPSPTPTNDREGCPTPSSARVRAASPIATVEEILAPIAAALASAALEAIAPAWSAFAAALTHRIDIEERPLVAAMFRDAPRDAQRVLHQQLYLKQRLAELSRSARVDPFVMRAFLSEVRAHARQLEPFARARDEGDETA